MPATASEHEAGVQARETVQALTRQRPATIMGPSKEDDRKASSVLSWWLSGLTWDDAATRAHLERGEVARLERDLWWFRLAVRRMRARRKR